ncbi:FUSC family protein [Microcoleus sp. FACHB-SPT15]|uniref:FUSC family protein n=1 Tax=Microcoleus sp. FACHB-SPT15 TaxID=2692830 RepID=UPI0017863BC0|nr:FUSC family protein [Microcoleus sp. FACHB-SPT15]MBD1807838.1 FUSC family protein [Microcoleus sp. FACHB-SPT15]
MQKLAVFGGTGISTGYWITLTAVVALKPNYGGTSQTTLQWVLDTVLGGIIGIGIVTLIHNSWAIGGCLLLFIVTAVAVRPLSFSLFITLLTPAIILLVNVTSNGGWQIGVLRIVDILAGGILALLGSFLLFPRWERQQLPAQLETTIRATLAYFQQAIALMLAKLLCISRQIFN